MANLDGVVLQVQPAAGGDLDELMDVTGRLRAELLDLDVAAVDPVSEATVPAYAMGLGSVAGWLVVQLGTVGGLRAVVDVVRGWAARTNRVVEVSCGGITITPADVPEVLRSGLDSSHPAIRLGAVAALGEWLADDDPARVLAARLALRQVADTDIPRVATAAQTLLDPPQSQPSPQHGTPDPGTVTADPVTAGRWRRLWPFGRASRSLPAQPAEGATRGPSRPAGSVRSRRRRLVYAAAAALVVAAAGAAVTALILDRGGPSGQAGPPAGNEITAAEPWRLFVTNTTGDGCSVTVTNTDTGDPKVFANIWGEQQFQMPAAGTFRWEADDPGCLVVKHAGPGNATLPFSADADTGDTDVFAAPKAPGKVVVQVKEFNSYGTCTFELVDAADGRRVDVGTVDQGDDPRLPLDPNGRTHVYLARWSGWTIQVSPQP